MKNQYAQRDPEAQGEHYMRHLSAMTDEGLHDKSSIAAELAHRDMRIADLEAERDAKDEAIDALHCDLNELPEFATKCMEERDRLRAAAAWVKVTPDTMPPLGQTVLVVFREWRSGGMGCWNGEKWDNDDWHGPIVVDAVTHWMLFPALPVDEKEDRP